MDESYFNHIWSRVANLPPIWMVLWLGLTLLTVLLLILMRTRWGQSKPLHKCAVLSLLAHVLLGCFATTIQIVTGSAGSKDSPPIHVSISDGSEEFEPSDATGHASEPQPWAPRTMGPAAEPELADLDRMSPTTSPLERSESDTAREIPSEVLDTKQSSPTDSMADLPDDTPPAEIPSQSDARSVAQAETIETKPAQRESGDPIEKLLAMPEVKRTPTTAVSTQPSNLDRTLPKKEIPQPPPPAVSDVAQTDPATIADDSSGAPSAAQDNQTVQQRTTSPVSSAVVSKGAGGTPAREASFKGDDSGERSTRNQRPLPGTYRARLGKDREQLLEQYGGDGKTEAAVRAALKWLAAAQHEDGRWDADRHGAGREQVILGHDRRGAGAQADTGITGLALLAYLGAGESHLEGAHRDTVRRGLEFLLRSQKSDGNLAGDSSQFAQMYCHAMAAFALSEAQAMTGDERLKPAVEAAVRYSVATQHPTGGSWRYKHWRNHREDPGDTSLLGWQTMVLKSAEQAGVDVPSRSWDGVRRFLQSVSSSRLPGRASYRPGSPPSRVMTAEALYCRQLIQPKAVRPSDAQAVEYLLEELPGKGKANLYYWYYATLSLYQHQGPAWRTWNTALTQALLSRQRTTGDLAGSWSPDTVWGGYGGRVYSTAMGAMCLEVYYRYAPKDRTARKPLMIR